MYATHSKSIEGHALIHVTFERQTPEAAAPVIEVIYRVQFSDSFQVTRDNPMGLELLSATRTDTRENAELEEEERGAAFQCALGHASTLTPDW